MDPRTSAGLYSAQDEVIADIGRLDSGRCQAFAAGCAQRLVPVPVAVATPVTAALLRSSVDALWSVEQRSADELRRLHARIVEMPADHEYGGTEPRYWRDRGLSVVGYLLEAFLDQDYAGAAEAASEAVITMVGGMDWLMIHDWDHSEVLDPADDPEPSPLEAAELSIQRECLRLLRDRELGAARDLVHAVSERRAAEFRDVVTAFVARMATVLPDHQRGEWRRIGDLGG